MNEPRFRQWARSAFGVPLFWKILIANVAVVVAAVLLGWALGHQLAHATRSTFGAVATLTVAGMMLSLFVNAVILHFALEPLDRLERAAARVQDGELDARAPDSPLADPALRRLARTFNAALDSLADARRRVRILLARSMEAEETERRQVARALEDDAAQRLAGLLMQLRLLERDPDCRSLVALVETASEEIARVLEVVRGYASARHPAVLDELGLVAALEADARRIMEGGDLRVQFEGIEPRGLTTEVGVSLYRVLREALENAARHAAAHSIRVRITNGGESIMATVEDDGRGFDTALALESPGLAAMRERTESAGGRLSVWSAPGHGSRICVELPLSQQEVVPCRS